ncbi:MAG: RluA family pseudouridine synthase [Chitinophagales bacterium]|nr:RluA family pseudouridine synthase [Bacteroidota bacterium]
MAFFKHPYQIVFEDEQILVVNKMPYVLTVPDRFDKHISNLKNLLAEKYGDIWVVHRLDKDTSGLVIFAKTAEAHRHLSIQFEKRQTEKNYLAIVSGTPAENEGSIDAPIAENTTQKGSMRVSKQGKSALTHFKVLATWQQYSLLQVMPETGRTHQIRVHLRYIGHPLAIDPLYGNPQPIFLSSLKKKFQSAKFSEQSPLLDRTPLHAFHLMCQHPTNGQTLEWQADMPHDMTVLLKKLELLQQT